MHSTCVSHVYPISSSDVKIIECGMLYMYKYGMYIAVMITIYSWEGFRTMHVVRCCLYPKTTEFYLLNFILQASPPVCVCGVVCVYLHDVTAYVHVFICISMCKDLSMA